MNDVAKALEIGNPFQKDDEQKKPSEQSKKIEKKDDKNMLGFLNSKMKEMETEYDLEEHLVIDIGHAFTKIGYSGEDSPFLIEPSIRSTLKETDKKDEITFEAKYLYGYEIFQSKSSHLYDIKYLNPGCHRSIIDHHEFYDFLKVKLDSKIDSNKSPSDYFILINTPPIKNFENIVLIGKMLLEEMAFKGVAMMNSASLSLFSTGRTSGIVLECGEERTFTVPIYEGFPLYHALNKNKIGGKHLTEILSSGIDDSRIKPEDIETIRKIKHRMLTVPGMNEVNHYLNSADDIIQEAKTLYKLPDETIITIPKEARIRAAEFLFNPKYGNSEESGLINLASDSIKKTVVDNDEMKKLMLYNIVLAGGTSMMPGFKDRIFDEIYEGFRSDFVHLEPTVVAENNRYMSTWIGGSMLASMSTFKELFITKAEFNEHGDKYFQKIF